MIKYYLFLLSLASPLAAWSQDCPKGSFWVKPHPKSDYYKSDGTYVSATHVTGHCRSKSKAYEFWSSLLVNGRPEGWEYAQEKSLNWTAKEIEQFISAAERVPQLLRQKVKVFRMSKSKSGDNPASSSKNFMVLYNIAFNDKDKLERVLTHELAHELYRKFSKEEKEKFQSDMRWVWKGKGSENIGTWVAGRLKYVEHDSDTSPEEDFANGIESYLLNRTRLKFRDPTLYKWLKSKYGVKLELE